MHPPEYKGHTADEILGRPYVEDSAWHIWAALSWCDYAERKNAPMALHYAGLHLRTGIEQLWFEVLFAAKGGSISYAEYEKSVNTTTKLYKLIESQAPLYSRFAEFMEIVWASESGPSPISVVWDMDRLKRIHGECGNRVLHFQGILERGYLGDAWLSDRLKYLFDSAKWVWDKMLSGVRVVFETEGLKPEIYSIWERYRDGLIKDDDVRFSLKIVLPILEKKA